jgi:hypothetical protein
MLYSKLQVCKNSIVEKEGRKEVLEIILGHQVEYEELKVFQIWIALFISKV